MPDRDPVLESILADMERHVDAWKARIAERYAETELQRARRSHPSYIPETPDDPGHP